MVHITNTTQLSTFETIRTIITNNSTLNRKFNINNIVNIEPISIKFQSLPYIYVQIPSTETTIEVTNDSLTSKTFTIPIYMLLEYQAKDNVINYSNALIRAIESDSTLEALGYDVESIELVDVRTESSDSQTVITAEFSLELMGNVER